MATLKKATLRDVAAAQRALKLEKASALLSPLFTGIKEGLAQVQQSATERGGAQDSQESHVWGQFADAMQAAADAEISPDDFSVLAMANFPKDFASTLTKTRRAYISTAVNLYEHMLSTYAPMYATDVETRQEAYSNEEEGSRKVSGDELTAQRFIQASGFVIGEGAEMQRIPYAAARKVISGVNAEVAKDQTPDAIRFGLLLKDYTARISNTVKDRKGNAEKGITALQAVDVGEMIAWLEAAIKKVPKRHTVTEGKATPVGDAVQHGAPALENKAKAA